MIAGLTLVIPSWKGRALLERCLPSALQQKNCTVLVVENGIGDDTAALVHGLQKQYPQLELLQLLENHGYAGGVNAGVAAAKTKFVAVLCNDNEVDANWLSELIQAYGSGISEAKLPIAAVMSRSTVPGLDTSQRGTLNFLGRNVCFPDPRMGAGPVPIFYPGGNAFLLDKSILPEVFDPDYFTYHEDVYLGWRLRNLGYEVLYCHSSIAHSFDGGTTRKTPARTSYLTARNRWLNFLCFCEIKTLAKILPLLFLDEMCSVLFGKNRLAKIQAMLWLIVQSPQWRGKRIRLQAERRVSDREALRSMSGKIFSEPCSGFKLIVNRMAEWIWHSSP